MRMDKVRLQSSDTAYSGNRIFWIGWEVQEVILLDQTPEIAEGARSKAPLVLMILGLISMRN